MNRAASKEEPARRVLILDEEPFIQDTLKLNLAGRGLRAEFAENEAEAKSLLTSGSPPACVILDVLHSRLSAYRFLQWLKSQPALEAIPVVILTFKEKDPEMAFTYNVWVKAYLSKPFVPQEVADLVARLVTESERASRSAEERF